MPKVSLLLGRKTLKVYDVEGPTQVGRDEGMDIHIDNTSVSRKHAVLRPGEGGWLVEDMGSSNGTFVNGDRIGSPTTLRAGDEIGMGKFSLIWDKVVGDASEASSSTASSVSGHEGTMQIDPKEVEKLLQSSQEKRKAHLTWESGGQRGEVQFSEGAGVLFGTDELCDVRVPKGPKHHLYVVRTDAGCEARNLAMFGSMKVRGQSTKRGRMKDGDAVEMGGLKVTFVDELG